MRVLLLRSLLLAGCVVAALAPAPAQQPRRLSAEEHDQKLLSAQKVAADSAVVKKGSFTVKKIPGITDRPREALANSKPPKPDEIRRAKAANRTLQKAPLRAGAHLDPSFDLRDGRVAFPIQNQEQCGCCWIFGAVAAHEGNILFKNRNATLGLSEQYVVDRLAATKGIDPCDGGWFDMSLNFLRDEGTSTRMLFPYRGGVSNGRQERTTPIPFKASTVGYVGTSDNATPSVTEIKQAIAAYGAVTVAVYVGDAFQSYEKGIFGRGEPPGEVNHAVALVGWDDNPPEFKDDPALRDGTNGGVWILRNSWSTAWGEQGYMRIAYNSSFVGYGAMWIEAQGGDPPGGSEIVPCGGKGSYQQQVQDRIKFYEDNYKQYLPTKP